MSDRTRDAYWDAVKGLLIVLVVLGHLTQVCLERLGGGGYHLLEAVTCTIYIFHMPLFVFVSGLFSKNVERCGRQALSNVLIPYLLLQFVWLIWITLTSGPKAAVSVAFYPQFSLWYLFALFLWRSLLPALIRIRRVLWIALALFFLGQLFGGLDNLFGLERAVGFLIYFLMGYFASGSSVAKLVVRIPLLLALAVPCACLLALLACFSFGMLDYETVFFTLTHGRSIWQFSPVCEGLFAYLTAFVASIAMSVCIMRLVMAVKEFTVFAEVGSNTMPLYAVQGFVVQAVCDLLFGAGVSGCSEYAIVAMFLAITIVVTLLFSNGVARRTYSKLLYSACRHIVRDDDG